MRHTTRLPHQLASAALVLLGTACMGTVGGDPGNGSRKPKEETTAGCENPTEIATPVTIRSDADFADLPTDCWDLFAKLRIEGPSIVSLDKLGRLKGVNDLEIVDTGLTAIDTKLPLAVYGAVTITGNKALASLANMPVDNADDLTATYTIRNNPQLTSLDGIKYITAVEGELRITDNPLLGDITLDELTTVSGAVTIANTGATRIDLGSLQAVHRLEISGNPKLTSFDGVAASVVKGDLVLRGNPQLATLTGVSSITRVEGALTIDGNGLRNLDAFGGLQLITSSLSITNNPALETLGRFSHLAGIGTTVSITNNPALPYCLAHEIDHCVTSGTVTVTNNKPNTQTTTCPCWCTQP